MPRTAPPWWLVLSLRFAATRVGTWVLSQTLPRIDRALQSVSGGRLSISRVLSTTGVPIVELTTVGAKSGKRRSVPVLGYRDGREWVVVASNWGREAHPAWYHNLRANPEVELAFRGETDQYVAREVTGAERAAYWRRLRELNPELEPYQERSGDRDLPVVVLTPKPMAQARTAPGSLHNV
ncbi:nitroreductase family deazaflavin-dependent oxidoreductase [Halobacterium wangiae]|uniref:nitroreductase family deazaflavin-dependent oxidoreductase n=1 Tax=Halobacterium wangiae TaxID=2902623 RepID=UPI001E4DA22C|nr:nitroreductase family deazaflavin-dependent oxidoreductase [Halobacterium wangiae]